MATKTIDVPEELLALLQRCRLGRSAEADRVKAALAIHLFMEGLVSIGKAAELAGVPRIDFEWLVCEMGLPTIRYDEADADQDRQGLAEAARRRGASV
jgi:predicted HTH domain antitoxin